MDCFAALAMTEGGVGSQPAAAIGGCSISAWLGTARPAIISRNSWRAATWPMPDFAEVGEIEQGQALGEELAVDDALAKAGDDAEADAAGKLVERGADALEVVRFDVLEAVAQHDPVDALAGVAWRAGCGCSRSVRRRSWAW